MRGLYLLSILFFYLSGSAQSLLIVDKLTDNNTLTGEGIGNRGDLRYCMSVAGLNADTEINFEVDGTISLNDTLPAISQKLFINANERNIEIDGQQKFRIFSVASSGHLKLKKLNLMRGFASYATNGGGAILNNGFVEIDSCNVINNSSEDDAGAIANRPNSLALVTNSYLYGNLSGGFGGAVYNLGSITVMGCVFERDTSSSADGAIGDYGNAIIKQSQFLYNSAFTGASAYGAGNLSGFHLVENCVFYENGSYAVPQVPAIRNTAKLISIHNSIYSSFASGVACESETGDDYTIDIINSVVAIEGNSGLSFSGTISGSSYNNIFSGAGAENIVNGVNGNISNLTDARAIFQVPGGDYYALGLRLAPYSEAIDGGIVSIAGFIIPTLDLKDSIRDSHPDLGAIEYQKLSPNILLNIGSTIVYTPSAIPLSDFTNADTSIKYSVQGPAALINQTYLSLTGIGILTIVGSVNENRYFLSATLNVEVEVIKAEQSIVGLNLLTDLAYKGETILIPLPTTSTVDLPVEYQLETIPEQGVASIVGTDLVILGFGSVSLNALQLGNEFYNSYAESVAFNVSDSIPTGININPLSRQNKTVVYPNPNDGRFTIQCQGNGHLFIYNTLGEEVLQTVFYNSIHIQLTQKGIYLGKIEYENGIEWTKILVE